MICKPCRAGGTLLAQGTSPVACTESLHGQCKGGTHCDCQHLLTSVLAKQGDKR